MTTPSHCPPAAESAPPVCGWTIGFQRGGHCTRSRPEDGAPLCLSHRAVEKRIDARAKSIYAGAQRSLTGESKFSRRALREIGNPRAIAEAWWIREGVRVIPPSVYAELLDGAFCAYCGSVVSGVVDHVVPVVQGGLSESDNLVAACDTCNAEKSDLTPDQWRRWRAEHGLCWPPERPGVQARKAVEAMMAADPPAFLADLVYRPLADGADRPAGYRADPRWLTAQAVYTCGGRDGSDQGFTTRWFRTYAAVDLMYQIEIEYETEEQPR